MSMFYLDNCFKQIFSTRVDFASQTPDHAWNPSEYVIGIWWVEAKDSAKYHRMTWKVPYSKELSSPRCQQCHCGESLDERNRFMRST